MKAAWITILFAGLPLWLVVGCSSELPSPGTLLYEGRVLKVFQTPSEIVVENIYGSPVVIRVSWDGKDRDGVGKGGDSFIDDSVEPNERISRKFMDHASAQIWAWDPSGALVDSCDLSVKSEPTPTPIN